ncbi:MAG: hemerythrin domain-containing protein [Corynebacteriales bacterium]|nr:hemerythrin domain-containing protein [Mycobacteriales bacterium]
MTSTLALDNVTPRQQHEPEVDLTSIIVTHRAMCTDLARFPAAVRDIAKEPVDEDRVDALVDYVTAFCAELHRHHHYEDHVLWPLIVASAGDAINLDELEEDHAELDPMMMRVASALAAFSENPSSSGTELADALQTLADHLIEHIGEEEAEMFPVIRRYVSARDFQWCESEHGAATDSFVLPWLMHYATSPERERLEAKSGLPERVLHGLAKDEFAKAEQLIFGPLPT